MSTRFAQYQVGLAPELNLVPDSFWRENVIAVVILLRECRRGGNKLSNVRSFIILRSAEGLTLLQ